MHSLLKNMAFYLLMVQNENTILFPTLTKGIVEHYFDIVKKILASKYI